MRASEWIAQHQGGSLDVEFGEALARLAGQVELLNKGGKLVLELAVKPMKNGTGVIVTGKQKLTLPEPDAASTFYYRSADGGLQRNHPDQPSLPTMEA